MSFSLPPQLSFRSSRVLVGLVGSVLVVGLFLTIFFLGNQTNSQTKAALSDVACQTVTEDSNEFVAPAIDDTVPLEQEVTNATNALITAKDGLIADPTPERRELLSQAARKRKKAIVALMQHQPQAALEALQKNQTDESLKAIGQYSPDCIEAPKAIEGEFQIEYVEGDELVAETYFLFTPESPRIRIYPTVLVDTKSGSKVRVTGYQIGDNMVVDNNQSGAIQVLSAPAEDAENGGPLGFLIPKAYAQTPPSKGMMVVLAYFSNTPRPTLTKAQVEKIVFTDVSNFFKQTSYGKSSVYGTVMDWVQLPTVQTCDRQVTRDAIFKKTNLDLSGYSNFIVIAPYGKEKTGETCGWYGNSSGGSITIPTTRGDVKIGVMSIKYNASISIPKLTYIIAHERGHNFGFYHAAIYKQKGTIFCDGIVQYETNPCIKEYGDAYDVMGGSTSQPKDTNLIGFYSAPRIDSFGGGTGWWFSQSNKKIVNTSGRFSLEPLEVQGSSHLKVLKIPRIKPGETQRYIYVEFRQPIGVDAAFSPANWDIFSGVLLHTGKFWETTSYFKDGLPISGNTRAGFSDFVLLNATGGDNNNAALKPGSTFTDPETKTSIKLVSLRTGATLSDARAVVDVLVNGSPIQPTPTPTRVPTITPAPTKIVLSSTPTPTKIVTPTPQCLLPEGCAKPTLSLSLTSAVQQASVTSPQLSWSALNATTCSASGGWTGVKATSGKQSIGPLTKTTTFTLTCSGPGGSVTKSTMLTVVSSPTPTKMPPTPTKKPSPTPTTKPTATPATKVSGADLMVVSIVLTDVAGRDKRIFKVGERIYPKVIFSNKGARKAVSKNGYTYSQIYANKPQKVSFDTETDVHIWMRNGEFGSGFAKRYGASPAGPNDEFYKANKYWSMSKPGTYTARAFINYDRLVTETDYLNNQAFIQYIVGK